MLNFSLLFVRKNPNPVFHFYNWLWRANSYLTFLLVNPCKEHLNIGFFGLYIVYSCKSPMIFAFCSSLVTSLHFLIGELGLCTFCSWGSERKRVEWFWFSFRSCHMAQAHFFLLLNFHHGCYVHMYGGNHFETCHTFSISWWFVEKSLLPMALVWLSFNNTASVLLCLLKWKCYAAAIKEGKRSLDNIIYG